MKQTMNPAVAKVLKRLHFPLDDILLCVRWYSAYPLSLRHLEEMMAERGILLITRPYTAGRSSCCQSWRRRSRGLSARSGEVGGWTRHISR
jgi:transposase-like protein